MMEQYSIEYPVLADSTTFVTHSWGIFNLLNDGVAAPAAYVFDASGDLVAYRVGQNIGQRPSADEIVAVLEAL